MELVCKPRLIKEITRITDSLDIRVPPRFGAGKAPANMSIPTWFLFWLAAALKRESMGLMNGFGMSTR